MRGKQDGQTSYLYGDVPVECVGLMPVSLTAARGPGTVCTGAQREPAHVEPLGAQPFQEGNQPHSPSQNQIQFSCPLFPREKIYQGKAARVAAHRSEVHPGEGNILLEKLGRPLQKTRRSIRYGVCYKCGDLHTNLSTHSSGCDRTPSDTIPPHSDGLGGEPSTRKPDTPSTPAAENSNQSEQSSPSIRYGAHARYSRLNNPCQDVSLHGKNGSAGAPNALCPQPEACPTHFLSSSQCSTGRPSRRSPQQGPRS